MADGEGPTATTTAGLPYGVARHNGKGRVVVAHGDDVIDLDQLHLTADGLPDGVFATSSLNPFMGCGPAVWRAVREQLVDLVAHRAVPENARLPLADVELLLPFEVADYVDFYASEHHATNMGKILRPGTEPLPAAWRHLPIGYHGRSGTVMVSGAAIPRPVGIINTPDGPRYEPCRRLDVEVELGFVIGVPGQVFGAVLVNDWSARDIQAFEYQPLGPFLGKSFATSIAPWVVPLDALHDHWVEGPAQDPSPLPHLAAPEPRALDIELELVLNGTVVSRTNARHLYWSMAQQLTHMTSNGATTRTGDLFASGTISGPEPDSLGSFMELSWGGTRPIDLDDGTTRTWLEDGDRVSIRGWCGADVGFGEVVGTIVPSLAP
jgi:fumarylacetoacetase